MQKYADVNKISKKKLIRNVHINDVLLWGKFQHLKLSQSIKLSQSKVIQKISFADISIFAFFATFIHITLFRQTKQLSHSTFYILQLIRFQKGMNEHLLVSAIGD